MNLGGFAGGLAQGMDSTRRFQAQQEEVAANRDYRERNLQMQQEESAANRGLRERQLAMAEKDQKFQDDERARAAAKREALAKLYEETHGPNGPKDDNERESAYVRGIMKLNAESMSPDVVLKVGEQMRKLADTEKGKIVMGVLDGSPDSIEKFGEMVGKKGAKGTFVRDITNGKFVVKWSDGGETDLKEQLVARGLMDKYDELAKVDKDGREVVAAKDRSNLTRAQINAQNAAAGASSATTNLRNAQVQSLREGGSTTGKKAAAPDKAIIDAVRVAFPKDAKALDGKSTEAAVQHVLGRASELYRSKEAKTPNEAVSAASREWRDAASKTDARIKQLRDAGKKPRDFDAETWDEVRIGGITEQLGQGASQPAPAAAPVAAPAQPSRQPPPIISGGAPARAPALESTKSPDGSTKYRYAGQPMWFSSKEEALSNLGARSQGARPDGNFGQF